MDLIVPKTKDVFPAGLSDEITSSFPSAAGIVVSDTEIKVQPVIGSFDTTTADAIKAIIDAHDPVPYTDAIQLRKDIRKAERAKKPNTLSTIDRIKRIEILMGLD